ncbi:MAG TPA: PKD domain-containing protein, partial [Thermoplasmata archaeon]|nr:PKD domain-containing protein [Thermoplasmata archaeon]
MVLASYPPIGGVLLFGGVINGATSNRTWLYNGSGWTLWTGHGPAPSARAGSQGAWDPAEGGVLLYGGLDPAGQPTLNDTWLFRNNAWFNLTSNVSGNPGHRGAGQLAVDPGTGAAVLFGGVNAPGSPTNATWTFANGTWSDVSSTAGAAPPARVFPGVASDPAANGVLVYGGQTYSGPNFNDTWLFRNGSWSQLHPTISPGPLRGPFLSADSASGSVVLYGGDTGVNGFPTNATWRFNASGQWANLTDVVGSAPVARWTGGMADAPGLGGVVLVGGCEALGCASAANDTWVLASAPAISLELLTVAPVVGAAVALQATASGGVPPWRFSFDFGDGTVSPLSVANNVTHVYRSCGAFEATVSGTDSVGTPASSGPTEVLVGGVSAVPQWCAEELPVAPSERGSVVFVNDPAFGADLLFGGTEPNGTVVNDTWLRTPASWEMLPPSRGAPSPRGDARAWYDPVARAVILFGGQSSRGQFLSDTWSFDGNWTNITSRAGIPPSGRFEPSVVYDTTHSEAVLFGGLSPTGPSLGDTWTFSAGRWANVTSSVHSAPSPRYWASEANDPSDGGVVLFGGRYCGAASCGDTWIFNGTAWSQVAATGPAPSARRGSPFAYDSAYGADLLFGGAIPASGGASERGANDTWVFARGGWTNVTSLVGPDPPGRWATALTYDTAFGGVVEFGGCTEVNCHTSLNDSWSLDIPSLVASVRATPSGTTAPANDSLSATASGGLGALSYSWAFGDGTYDNLSATASLTHRYATKGNYSGTLTVADSAGVFQEATWNLSLASPSVTNKTPKSPSPNGTTPIPPHKAPSGPPGWWTWAIVAAVVGVAAVVIAVAAWKWRGGSRKATPGDRNGLSEWSGSAGGGVAALPAAPSSAPDSSADPEPAAVPVGATAAAAVSGSYGSGDLNGPLGERILVHLHRQGRIGSDELASMSVTQAGLSN